MRKIKILLSIGALFFGMQIMSGQGWERIYDDFGVATSIVQTADEGFVFGGENLVKIDNTGNVLWQKDINNGILSLEKTHDNGFIVCNNNFSITKTNNEGEIEWQKDSLMFSSVDIQQTLDRGYILTGHVDSFLTAQTDVVLLKMDSLGNTEWKKVFDDYSSIHGYVVELTSDGGFVIGGRNYSMGAYEIIKTDALGNIQWQQRIVTTPSSPGSFFPSRSFLIESSDGGIVFTGYLEEEADNPQFDDIILYKLDANGNISWNRSYELANFYDHGRAVIETPDGGFAIAGETNLNCFLMKTDSEGNLLWEKRYGFNFNSDVLDIGITTDNGFILAGSTSPDFRAYIIKTDSLGNTYTNQIQGNIWKDAQEDCIQAAEESTLENWIVQAQKEDRIFYATTDSLGYYKMTVDTGSYVVNVVRPSTYWGACEDSITFSFTNFFDTTQVDYPMLSVVDCPLLEVDVSTPFLRRCFDSNYYIQYCNKGTTLAEDAYITVNFDDYLTINSTSILPSNIEDNIYTFEIGDVAVGECGTFEVNVTIDCDSTVLGQTHCVEANIFPDSLCLPLDPNWDQANIEVNAECMGDSILFIIQNTGVGDMGQSNDYLIVIDDLVLRSAEYQINSGTTESFKEVANGETFRLQTMQTDGHPIDNMPSVTIEGCGTEDPDSIHIGFVTQFPEDDDGPFVSIDCQENIGSYDPNDKQAYPKGASDAHFIEQNTDIEYKIRFQNTGTDTAFTVVVIDTLAQFLEPTSIVPGASSHPYTFELYGYGVVKFTFDNILLVDSTTNEAGSHGFIKFRIAQKENNPLGTMIENSASIYFDFNAPIITNTTLHTVGEDFLALISSTSESAFENTRLSVYPNPVENVVTFHLEGVENVKQIELNLYDMTGRLLRTEMHNSSTFQFSKGDLLGGMYFYSIKTEKGEVNSGKLIVK